MKYFKTSKNEIYAYEDDADKKYYRRGLIAITEEEAKAILNKPLTAEQIKEQAESDKSRLLAEANSVIALLERSVRLGMATEKEILLLEEWERYSVKVSRVDTSDPVWPEVPYVA
ncbi:tail fiber assembly protein [Salmonella enterica]|nr:tail fiber assembly protein [Salmonella enterica]EBI0350900.1 tail fiber assembly protein [Salmonella enterica subsp. arizonae serovar 48:z4,z23,z32:-]EBM5794780.1 phage tail protein [Salmonella enterica]EBS9963192.1 tail fiber assembly protein [Salmonella enterica]EDZ6957521.1 tail fiber assembly protein [Salmonella enterica]